MVVQLRNMSCWYASACMVNYFHEAGPRLGIPQKWEDNHGISIPDFVVLAKNENLQPLNAATGNFTEQQLENHLKAYGPIWCAGRWDGLPHIVVLTGVENGSVYINDPNPAKRERVESLAWFNQKLDGHVAGCMMHRRK